MIAKVFGRRAGAGLRRSDTALSRLGDLGWGVLRRGWTFVYFFVFFCVVGLFVIYKFVVCRNMLFSYVGGLRLREEARVMSSIKKT